MQKCKKRKAFDWSKVVNPANTLFFSRAKSQPLSKMFSLLNLYKNYHVWNLYRLKTDYLYFKSKISAYNRKKRDLFENMFTTLKLIFVRDLKLRTLSEFRYSLWVSLRVNWI